MVYSLYRFVAGGHFVWVVKAAALGAALPLRKTWGAIKFVASWFNFGWANLPIIFGAREPPPRPALMIGLRGHCGMPSATCVTGPQSCIGSACVVSVALCLDMQCAHSCTNVMKP